MCCRNGGQVVPHAPLRLWTSALLLAVLVGTVRLAAAGSGRSADDYWSRREALDAVYAAQLHRLADKCLELNLAEEAQLTRAAAFPRDPRRQYLFLPAETDPARPSDDAPKIVHQWYAALSAHRSKHADALFELARSELQADRATRAYQLLHEVLFVFPDHEAVRGILGYRLVQDRWRKPESVIRTRRAPVANPELGFDAGKHWIVESERFRITTDHSEEAGTQLAERLEVLYAAWQQLFFSSWSNAAVLTRRFEGKVPAARSTTRHRVVLFRDRDTYVHRLQRVAPQFAQQIGLTSGIYLEVPKTAYFFVDTPWRDDIYYHEVTHQLFSETGRVSPEVGVMANMWIVEGVALYMESLRKRRGYWTVGGIAADRLQTARHRALNEGFYVPLDELAGLGRQAWQQRDDMPLLYTQAAGLGAFLMDYERGRYRPLLADYLQAVYQGRDNARTLAALADVPLAEMDRQYREFLDVTDEDLAFLEDESETWRLLLGRTSVTDAGLKHIGRLTQLELLELSHTAVTDAGLDHLDGLKNLESIGVSGTRVTLEGFQRLKQALPQLVTEVAGP